MEAEKISVYKLIETLKKNKPSIELLRLAVESDYGCYFLSSRTFKEDKYDDVIRIGYTQHVHLEGVQFITVCVIKRGKIVEINLDDYKRDLRFLRRYLENQEGLNVFVHMDESL